MADISSVSREVLEVLRAEFEASKAYQLKANKITVQMTFAAFVGLWSDTRIQTIQKKLNISRKALEAYLNDRFYRPVLSWRRREDRVEGGVMTASMARIMRAEDSRKMFQMKAGDSHSPAARQKIGEAKRGKKQTPEQIAKRTASRVATMAAKRAERENQQ